MAECQLLPFRGVDTAVCHTPHCSLLFDTQLLLTVLVPPKPGSEMRTWMQVVHLGGESKPHREWLEE